MASALPLEGFAAGGREGLQVGGVAVVGGHDLARAFDTEVQPGVSTGHGCALGVSHPHGHEGQILPIVADRAAVHAEQQAGCGASGALDVSGPRLALAIATSLSSPGS